MSSEQPDVRPHFWQGQRFRRFILLSVAVHAVVGAIWGVPGYVRMREEEEQQRQAMLTFQREREAAEATLKQATQEALERTKAEVAEAARRTFDALVKELPAKQKEKVWEKVSAKISPASEAFAKALADRTHTEQDLQNIQADLNRELVEETEAELTISVSQMLAEDFVASVQQNVVPEAVRHYEGQVEGKIGNRLRGDGEKLINEARKRTEQAMTRVRERADRARGPLDGVRQQVGGAPEGGKLSEAARRMGEVERIVGEIAKGCEGVEGAEGMAATAVDAVKIAGEMKAGIATAQEHVKAKRVTEATVAAADVAMAETRLRPLLTQLAELSGRPHETADVRAREAIGWVRDESLIKGIDGAFAEAFATQAGPRMVGVLMEKFAKMLEGRSLKDEKLVEDVRQQVTQIVLRGVGQARVYHEPGTRPLEDLARKREETAGASETLRGAFAETAKATLAKGIAEIMKDAGADGRLADRTNLPINGMEDDVRYRLETMANNAREGRTLGMLDNIGSGNLTVMRESALSRAAMLEEMQATAAAGGAIGEMGATTQMADPTVAQVTEELAAEMQADFRFLMGGKLNEKAEGIWKNVRGRTAAELTALAEALLDGGISNQELEKLRLAFSEKFFGAMQGSLDASAAGDMSDALLKELQGGTGDRIAQRYQGLVRDTIGSALQRELQAAANQKRGGAFSNTRGLVLALEGAKDSANKAAELADQARGRLGKPSTQPATLAEAEVPVIDGIGDALAKTEENVQQAAGKATTRPVEVVEGVKATVQALEGMQQATEKAEAAAAGGDAAAAAKELEAVRASVTAVHQAAGAAQGALNKELDDEIARFAAAVRMAERGGEGGGIHGDVAGAFDEQFGGQMLPRLTDSALEAYKRRLRDTGVNAEVDEKRLRADIAAALRGKVGGAAAGDVAIARVEEADFMRHAEKGKAEDGAAANVRTMARGVIKDSVGRIGRDGGAYEAAGQAANGLAADGAYGEVKGRVGQYASSLRAGRGGVLAGEMEGEGDGEGGGRRLGLMGIRGKWQGMVAGNGAGGAGGAMGAGTGNGRAGRGLGRGVGRGRGTISRFDEEQYAKLTAETKDRDKNAAQGEEWERQGAMGDASRAADRELHPAAIVLPVGQPSAQTSNDQPYAPTFKSIKFMSIPYLNAPFTMDGNYEKWKDVPGFDLLPERGDGQGIEGLTIVEKIPAKMAWDATGLYVWVDVTDADNKLLMAAAEGSFAIADVAEIWVDTLNTKERQRARAAGQQFWIWPDGMVGHPEFTGGESTKDLTTGYIPTKFTMESLQRAVKKTDQGYTMEFHLPMERLRDAEMAAGKIVGFNMTVETGTKIHYYWSASKAVGTWGRPDTWGDILLAGSDGKLEIPAKLSWERSAEEADKVLETFVVGEPLRIRVTDRDMNLNSDKRDKVSVTIRAGGEQEVAILEETGNDTGAFEGSIRTALSFGERVPGTLSVYEGQKIQIAYIDQARANGARNTQLKFTVQAGAVVTGAGMQQAAR